MPSDKGFTPVDEIPTEIKHTIPQHFEPPEGLVEQVVEEFKSGLPKLRQDIHRIMADGHKVLFDVERQLDLDNFHRVSQNIDALVHRLGRVSFDIMVELAHRRGEPEPSSYLKHIVPTNLWGDIEGLLTDIDKAASRDSSSDFVLRARDILEALHGEDDI